MWEEKQPRVLPLSKREVTIEKGLKNSIQKEVTLGMA